MVNTAVIENKIKTYRWFFYISLIQLLAYFVVPVFLFPSSHILHIEIISALTLGLIVGLFFLIVNICGLYIDRIRRRLYILMIILISSWFLWAVISWSYIEHMDYLLH
ncbi:MAG: hypothetical protein GY855_16550 [candidate division Zixibacteria bacterium]|nr:hypothetical protein [candidate division Zixibacteria bacterium]